MSNPSRPVGQVNDRRTHTAYSSTVYAEDRSNYWLRRRLTRRQALRAGSGASLGAAGLLLTGCGANSKTTPPAVPTVDAEITSLLPQLAPEVRNAAISANVNEVAVFRFLADAQKNVGPTMSNQRPMEFSGNLGHGSDMPEYLSVKRQLSIVVERLWDLIPMAGGKRVLFVVTSPIAGFDRTQAEPFLASERQLLPKIESWLGIPFPYQHHHAQVLMDGRGSYAEGDNIVFGRDSPAFAQAHERVHLWQAPFAIEDSRGRFVSGSLPVALLEAIADLVAWQVLNDYSEGYFALAKPDAKVDLDMVASPSLEATAAQASSGESWLGDLARAMSTDAMVRVVRKIMASQPLRGLGICRLFEGVSAGSLTAVSAANEKWVQGYFRPS